MEKYYNLINNKPEGVIVFHSNGNSAYILDEILVIYEIGQNFEKSANEFTQIAWNHKIHTIIGEGNGGTLALMIACNLKIDVITFSPNKCKKEIYKILKKNRTNHTRISLIKEDNLSLFQKFFKVEYYTTLIEKE